MGLFGKINLKSLFKQPPFWSVQEMLSSGRTNAGVNISPENSLGIAAFYAGVSLIAQTVGQVPLILYERDGRSKIRSVNNQLYDILHLSPNPEMSAMTFKEVLTGHLLTWGNAYAEIAWEPRGYMPMALWPMRPDRMRVTRNEKTKALEYNYTLPNGNFGILPAERVLHIPGFGFDGTIGYDPVTLWRETLGLTRALEQFGASFFGNGTTMSGVLSHPDTVSPEAQKIMRQSFEDLYKGLDKSHRIAILQEGVTFKEIGVQPENAQFLQSRMFQINEIARVLHIPPHMIGAKAESGTYANIESQSIEFVTYCMLPWFTRIEQAINRKLLSPSDQKRLFSEFLVPALLRADSAARGTFYQTRFNMGSLSPNDIRAYENENPIEDPMGDEYFIPVGMIPLSEAKASAMITPVKSMEELETKARSNERQRMTLAYRPVFERAAAKLVKAEVEALQTAAVEHLTSKAADGFTHWMETYYKSFNEITKRQMMPVFIALAGAIEPMARKATRTNADTAAQTQQFVRDYQDAFTARHAESSKGQMIALMDEARADGRDVLESVTERLTGWQDTRAGKIAMNETVQLANGVARTVFAAAGIRKLIWQNHGSDTCPYCQQLDGRVVGIEKDFISEGENLRDEHGTMEVRGPKSHPPLHLGCMCSIEPA